jgi:hypothetical protein
MLDVPMLDGALERLISTPGAPVKGWGYKHQHHEPIPEGKLPGQ